MKTLIGLFGCILLVSCAMGPVQVAKNESEAFKTTYADPDLARVYQMNQAALRSIYLAYKNAGIDFYYDGVEVIGLKSAAGTQQHYVSIKLRPAAIVMEREVADADKWPERLQRITHQEFPKYIQYLKKSDLQFKDIEGIAFGIYWPLRDYTQCDKYGGCIEYAIVYLTNQDVADILSGARPFLDVAKQRRVVASFNSKPAETVRVQ